MDNELYAKVKDFRTEMAIVKEMLSRGIISSDDYSIICTVLAEKYGLKSSTIFSEIDLICAGDYGNIAH